MKTRVWHIAAVLIGSAFLLSGCGIMFHGRSESISQSIVDTIRIGSTTKEQIVQMFGQPQQIAYRSGGEENYIYQHGVESSIGLPFLISIGRSGSGGQTLTISFEGGVVVDYTFTVDQRKMVQ